MVNDFPINVGKANNDRIIFSFGLEGQIGACQKRKLCISGRKK